MIKRATYVCDLCGKVEESGERQPADWAEVTIAEPGPSGRYTDYRDVCGHCLGVLRTCIEGLHSVEVKS